MGDIMLRDLVEKNRSYRRFYQNEEISYETLLDLIDLSRLTPSAANKQPLRYIVSHYPEKNAMIFSHLAWAAYLSDWKGPEDGERPAAYIVMLSDMTVMKHVDCDHGIAAQTILLGAVERGLGGCIIANIRREELRIALNIPVEYEIKLAIALGRPREIVKIEPIKEDGDIRYWRDDTHIHHVPKRHLKDLILDL
jgi:nitroreductase